MPFRKILLTFCFKVGDTSGFWKINARLCIIHPVRISEFFLFFGCLNDFARRQDLNIYLWLSWNCLHRLGWHSTLRQISPFEGVIQYSQPVHIIFLLVLKKLFIQFLFCVVCTVDLCFYDTSVYVLLDIFLAK